MRRPISTYRLQIHSGFGFAAARHALAYLDELGITDIYTSPYLQAVKGSTHGYDVVNPTRVNEELGGETEWRAFSDEMLRRGIGHVLDIVPNHMGIEDGNDWWWDVLENGPSSLHANHFDIDWNPPKESLRGRVLLPVLGGQFSEVLERGELKLARKGWKVELAYYDHRFPLRPASLPQLLLAVEERSGEEESSPSRQELRSIARALKNLPGSIPASRQERVERKDEIIVIQRRLQTLLEQSQPIAAALDQTLVDWNGAPGVSHSFDKLEQLIAEQVYRLADWHVAAEEINYRRFFDVNQLVALRMEDPQVFEETHAFILKLFAEGRASGVRCDHTDGLRDPLDYFRRLREHTAGPGSFYIVAEKILGTGEQMPREWPIEGTTGYDFMIGLSGLFVDQKNEAELTAIYQELTGDRASWEEHAMNSRRLVMRASLPSEVHTLSRALERLSSHGTRPHDFTNAGLQSAITETVAAFPVYRTYLRADGSSAPADKGYIERSIELAKSRNPEIDAALFDFLREVLLLNPLPGTDEKMREEQIELVLRFQQLTPPMMAKGVEDTAFYTYRRFVSLNDVGGDPGKFGTSIQELHQANTTQRRDWPATMLASSTHDNKRGEDVRARLSVLSEMPKAWSQVVNQWSAQLAGYKLARNAESQPGRDDEYLLYQTLVGAFPFDGKVDKSFIDRIAAYMMKAVREAKQHTNWLKPDSGYEAALDRFVRRALADAGFLDSLGSFARKLMPAGIVNGLSQAILKLCSPGVADTYQGCEDWNLSLVDPDNRRPVDYQHLAGRLEELGPRSAQDQRSLCSELLSRAGDGDVKLYATHRLLRARRENPELFLEGDYQPLEAGEQVFAFARKSGSRQLICAVPRLVSAMTTEREWPVGERWGDRSIDLSAVAGGEFRNLLTGETLTAGKPVRLAELFATFPGAVLISTAG